MKLPRDIGPVHFIGIGGIGMSALARWFRAGGKSVSGYDRTETVLTGQLEKEGMKVNYTDTVEAIPVEVKESRDKALVVYTPAIPKDSLQLKYFFDQGFEIRKRSEILGMITRDHFTIAVAGTHGKTTTSSMIAHILHTAGRKSVAFLGGILQNYNSNLIIDMEGAGSQMIVVEADEYDRSFLKLTPDIAVVTAADADHLDIYGDLATMREAFGQFIGRIRENGKLFIRKGLHPVLPHQSRPDLHVQEYNIEHSAIRAENIRIDKEELRFDFISPEVSIDNISLSMPGNHNIENAIAAIAVCVSCGIGEASIKEAFATYRGVKRRFEYIILRPDIIFIDDYAHHPEEIGAFIHAVKSIYPQKKLTAVFQPHLFTRTRDFAREFAESLSSAEEVILLDIYPARELPVPGVTSELIFNQLTSPGKLMCSRDELLEILKEKKPELLATIGAGDIDKMVSPVKEMLLSRS